MEEAARDLGTRRTLAATTLADLAGVLAEPGSRTERAVRLYVPGDLEFLALVHVVLVKKRIAST